MKAKPYPKYKPSGMEWLGNVPEQWTIKPLFAVADEIKNKNTGMVEENLLSLSYGKIIQKDINTDYGLLPESFETYQIIELGDIILRLTDLQNDHKSLRVGCVEERGIITSAYLNLRTKFGVLFKYVFYCLFNYDVQKIFYNYGGGVRQSMRFADLKWLPIPLPSPPEQQAIVEYLDRETDKIDTLIAKKKRLIELLWEKRMVLISNAVTKGLDLTVKLKPSGVEWLGEVPEHWESVSLKWVSQRYSGGTPDKSNQDYWTDGAIPWLNSGAVNAGYITEPSEYITEDAYHNSSAKWIPKNALVIALAGQGKTKGMVAQLGIKTTCNQSMAAIIPNSYFLPRFLYWWVFKNYNNLRNLAGGDARDGLNLEMIGSIPCPIMPLSEQQAIATFLDYETGKIDTLILKIETVIEKLTEYRTALISAAVTGKIDVRNIV